MGYVLGFFVGDHHAHDDVNRRRWEEVQSTAAAPPAPAVVDFVHDATRRWPDSEDSDDDESPWGDAPLLANASGDVVLVNISIDQIPSVFPTLLEIAWSHGLVCFDPATDRVIDSL